MEMSVRERRQQNRRLVAGIGLTVVGSALLCAGYESYVNVDDQQGSDCITVSRYAAIQDIPRCTNQRELDGKLVPRIIGISGGIMTFPGLGLLTTYGLVQYKNKIL